MSHDSIPLKHIQIPEPFLDATKTSLISQYLQSDNNAVFKCRAFSKHCL